MAHRRRKRLAQKAGLPPGTVVAATDPSAPEVAITCTTYDASSVDERPIALHEAVCPAGDQRRVTWINVDGVHRPEVLEHIGRQFNLHPLLLEDVAHTQQRPKLEDYGAHLFMDMNTFRFEEGNDEVVTEQVSLVLGANWVLTFNERPQPYVKLIRDRLRADKMRAHHPGADYLAYSVIDAVVDGYYVILERVGDRIEEIEEELMADPRPPTLQAVYAMKRRIAHLRKSIWPMRELVAGLQRERDLVREETGVYLRDLYDHTVQIIDAVETFRDMISGMLEMYLSSLSNRMNEVMKVLTIIATIFIPLTFIAGVYGMNFDHMPELRWRYGYLAVWGAMAAVGAGMLYYFRRKKWI